MCSETQHNNYIQNLTCFWRCIFSHKSWKRDITNTKLNSLPHNSNFQWPFKRKPLKTLWEKEKMLETSIFSFSSQCFLPVPNLISTLDSHWFYCLQILWIWTGLTGVEINFFCYLQKIESAMISNLLNASCYSQNEKYDFLLYYCQYH